MRHKTGFLLAMRRQRDGIAPREALHAAATEGEHGGHALAYWKILRALWAEGVMVLRPASKKYFFLDLYHELRRWDG
jgi:hypothetical protein